MISVRVIYSKNSDGNEILAEGKVIEKIGTQQLLPRESLQFNDLNKNIFVDLYEIVIREHYISDIRPPVYKRYKAIDITGVPEIEDDEDKRQLLKDDFKLIIGLIKNPPKTLKLEGKPPENYYEEENTGSNELTSKQSLPDHDPRNHVDQAKLKVDTKRTDFTKTLNALWQDPDNITLRKNRHIAAIELLDARDYLSGSINNVAHYHNDEVAKSLLREINYYINKNHKIDRERVNRALKDISKIELDNEMDNDIGNVFDEKIELDNEMDNDIGNIFDTNGGKRKTKAKRKTKSNRKTKGKR